VNDVTERIEDDHPLADSVRTTAGRMLEDLKSVEEALYQTKNRSGQDPLNFPIRLNDKLAGVASTASTGDYRPTDQAYAVRDLLEQQIDEQMQRYRDVLRVELPNFNHLVREAAVPAVSIEE
jgi:hypothetical protein